MCLHFLNGEENKGLGTFLFTMLAALTVGVVMFPMIFAGNIWLKLNN